MPDRKTAPGPRDSALVAGALAASLALLGSLVPGPLGSVRAATAPKAVIIVGPVESQTNWYVNSAEQVAAVAASHGMTVVKLYSASNTAVSTSLKPTWQNVVAQAQGATLLVYMGHGNGYPNPYPPGYLMPDRVDGFVLDPSSGTPCALGSGKAYCGEAPIAANIRLATNALVLLNHLCYASGDSEPGNGQPTLSVAQQRVDNYASGFLRAGAAAVFAFGMQGVGDVIDTLYTRPNLTMDEVLTSLGDGGSNQVLFGSARTPGTGAHLDPLNSPQGGQTYYRSVAGHLEVTGSQVLGGAAPSPDPDRWAGADRYATAAAISAKSFPSGAPVAYVATGANFPDALAGAAAAHHAGGPVLLTAPGSLPDATRAELQRLHPARIVVLGSSGAVSDAVVQALQGGGYTSGGVTRVSGPDRYATAAAISAATFSPGPGPVNANVVYIATGAGFPDALVGAAAAGKDDAPLLLATRDALPQPTRDELTRLRPKRIVILGGGGAISSGVETALAAYTSGTITRLAGADRYATAVAISAATFAPGASTAYVATGANFPDALAGAALGKPLLLVPGAWIPTSIQDETARLSPAQVVVLGGIYVVSLTSETELKTAAGALP